MNKGGLFIKAFNLLKTTALTIKILDAKYYLDIYSSYEKDENQKILDLITYWLEQLENDLNNEIYFRFYHYPKSTGKWDFEQISHILKQKNEAFTSIIENLKYVPIQPPFPTLKTMVDEIIISIPSEEKVRNIHYKTISEYNFTESKMIEPRYNSDSKKRVEQRSGGVPNVLSMSVLYHDNPLMWPLIFHEYGHTIFKIIKCKQDYQSIYTKLSVFCSDNELEDIDQTKLNTLISEIFSDLFAVNYYHLNYFFAFYFHEILSKEVNELLDLPSNEDFIIQLHPPSAVRLKYMIKEIEKRGFSNNNVFKKIIEYQNVFADNLFKEMGNIPSKYLLLFEEINENVSEFIHNKFNPDVKILPKLTDPLYGNLQKRYPIGTSYYGDKDLKEILYLNESFNIENNNSIRDIIYIGWKYLILDMINNFFEIDDKDEYLPNTKIKYDDKDSVSTEKKIQKFSREYEFLISNIRYSIETSMIVSHYLEGSNGK